LPNKFLSVRKIVSGGQTGVDRAAWDFALANGIPIGGHVPKDRLAEDGTIGEKYEPLIETNSKNHAERTRLNVQTSDATLIFTFAEPIGGTRLTIDVAESYGRTFLVVDLSDGISGEKLSAVSDWLKSAEPASLNVAGPRASEVPEAYSLALEFLTGLI